MSKPELHVNLDAIEHNARIIIGFCAQHGIEVTGVTKVTCGMPSVARTLLECGATALGESRLENIHRMRSEGVTAPYWLLRIPPLSEVDEIVRTADLSLNSEIQVIEALSGAAQRQGLSHHVILMVDLGDLREGLWPEDLLPTVQRILDLPGIHLKGLGTNLTCYGGVLPTQENMQRLADYAKSVEDRFSIPMPCISGGNSSALTLIEQGKMPPEITNLRLGESLMLGRETAGGSLWPGVRTDAFTLDAELIEAKIKPSLPIGKRGMNAFGKIPSIEDRGERTRGILNIGREDVVVEGLSPRNEGVTILGASSDHLLVDFSREMPPPPMGSRISFTLDYGALLAAMTSAYVHKIPRRDEQEVVQRHPQTILTGSALTHSLPEENRSLQEALIQDFTQLQESIPPETKPLPPCQTQHPQFSAKERTVICGLPGELAQLLPQDGRRWGLVWLTPSLENHPLFTQLRHPEPNSPLLQLLSPSNCVAVGLREANAETRQFLSQHRGSTATMEDIDLEGLRWVMRRALEKAASGTSGVILCYNSQVTDGGKEGLTQRETFLAMELAARSGVVLALDLSDALPPSSQEEAKALRRYAATALGRRILD
ncbi:MAG: alanine racemase [Spirochaetales bacterium]|nr:alanine racemase [Spirochaetales bacterium]